MEEKVTETLESWAALNDFKQLVHFVNFWLTRGAMPDLTKWKYLSDYDDLKTVVRDLLNNETGNAGTN